jgi:hypothetical protein
MSNGAGQTERQNNAANKQQVFKTKVDKAVAVLILL